MEFEKIIKVIPLERLIEMKEQLNTEIGIKKKEERKKNKDKKINILKEIVIRNREKNNKKISEIIDRHNLNITDPAIPRGLKDNLRSSERQRAYIHIMNQDWSSVYQHKKESGRFYVYAHIDPTVSFSFLADDNLGGIYQGLPFYIGKGTGDRAYDLNRNQGHGKKLRQIIKKADPKDIVKIIFNNLSETKALELEAKLIFFFGTIYEPNRKNTCLYNLDIPQKPIFKKDLTIHYNKKIISDIKEGF